MTANRHSAWMRACIMLILLACTLPAFAQTRAWLDREQVTFGETATLNIEADTSVRQIDYAPLTANFDIAGQTVRRSFQLVNGRSSTRSLFAVGIRPRGPGVITIPSLRVGNASTQPLRLTVMPPSVQPASNKADVFVESEVDTDQPYVQQAVGMVVRLYYAVNLLSGQLDQDAPPGVNVQQVGEDLQYQKQVDGRRYNVIERRYLLVPERSGALLIPGARFNGQSVGDFFDGGLGDGRKPLSAGAAAKRLQVQAIPANAPQPWLPLHGLELRYLQAPKDARVGVATTIEIEMTADGATAAQLPALTFPASANVQVFADPPQTDVQLVDGRPRATLRRKISIVPLQPGMLSLAGPRIDWWNAAQGIARTATLPPLELQVAPGAATGSPGDDASRDGSSQKSDHAETQQAGKSLVRQATAGDRQFLPWLAALLGLAAVLGGWWIARHRKSPARVATDAVSTSTGTIPKQPSLNDALKTGDFAGIARALCTAAGLRGDDLDALRMQLDDIGQVAAVRQLQSARWAAGDSSVALVALRAAFAKGVRLRKQQRPAAVILPPLYPQS